eukprot:Nk52_evm64s1444 gene=Nk52_evmTU64s1444
MTKVAIVYYSMHGHIAQMVEAEKAGLEKVEGVEVSVYQAPETLSPEVLEKMKAAEKKDHPLATPDALAEADAILFGIPTRFGMCCAQIKALMDQTGGLWAGGKLVGKPAGTFFSTGTQGGGQETTALTFVTQLAHHGMVFVPIGYSSPSLMNMDEVHGGSPYGAGTLAGADGSRQPSEFELNLATHQGEHFGKIAHAMCSGK